MRILVTGGSGFIGTNLAETFRRETHDLLSLDIQPPRIPEHVSFFKQVDIRDAVSLTKVLNEFSPTHVVHMAARADLNEKKDIAGYSANTDGVRNLIMAISSSHSVKRCIFTSTKLIVPNASGPHNDQDFRPDTLYGQSKVIGEKIVRETRDLKCEWCIIRPTSIWGPWSDAPYNPYGRFFKTVAKGWYFHPGNIDPPRYFGYIGNVVYQVKKLLEAPEGAIQGKVFYLADYEIYHIKEWANLISRRVRGKPVKTIPTPLVRIAALTGDILKVLGFKNPPITSFRLRNMQADTTQMSLEPIRALTGSLPYTIEQGVDETIKWLRRSN